MAANMKLHKDLLHGFSLSSLCPSCELELIVLNALNPVSPIPLIFLAGFPHISQVLRIPTAFEQIFQK